MGRFRLTKAAEQDLEQIFDFGIDRFGLDQTMKYQVGLDQQLHALADQPLVYQAVDHIRPGYRRGVYRSHAIYYRVEGNGILIVRILGNQNPDTALSG
ncbi:type II toxin-antitoxin system RelE/ParE family toxin [Flagellatimonas centrodinii]|uniref:type II toxin-antitoxin system RelE/ParE family toxin n=1 Tax=Flagellatimonas centrodinii TaxID=2806210 RepID=UPI001FF07C56|nr:type II toxin-antitoxin system RelE/ParE family toxin [Flagellatimonas centrodinii]ULQ47711.1 type II toxin-antitoxin system RelE/ParE family toxin [Flagellatimonas centrodinii]